MPTDPPPQVEQPPASTLPTSQHTNNGPRSGLGYSNRSAADDETVIFKHAHKKGACNICGDELCLDLYYTDVHRVWDYTIPSRPSQSIVKRGHDFLQVCFSCRSNHEQASRLQLIFSRRAPYGQAHERAIVQSAEAVQDACAQLATAARPDASKGETAAAVLAAVTALGVDIVKNGADKADIPIVIAVNAADTAQSAAKEEMSHLLLLLIY